MIPTSQGQSRSGWTIYGALRKTQFFRELYHQSAEPCSKMGFQNKKEEVVGARGARAWIVFPDGVLHVALHVTAFHIYLAIIYIYIYIYNITL